MVMTTVADVPAVLPVVETAAIEDAAEEGVAGVLPGPPPDQPHPLSPTNAVAAMTPQTRAAIFIFRPPFAPIRLQPEQKRSRAPCVSGCKASSVPESDGCGSAAVTTPRRGG